jgi:hypothetical protein
MNLISVAEVEQGLRVLSRNLYDAYNKAIVRIDGFSKSNRDLAGRLIA